MPGVLKELQVFEIIMDRGGFELPGIIRAVFTG